MPAMTAHHLVAGIQRVRDADGRRFLPDTEVERPADYPLVVKGLHALLEASNQEEPAVVREAFVCRMGHGITLVSHSIRASPIAQAASPRAV